MVQQNWNKIQMSFLSIDAEIELQASMRAVSLEIVCLIGVENIVSILDERGNGGFL